MNCYLCGSSKHKLRSPSVRDSKNLKVLECTNCGLVFLSSFDHINNDHYEKSGMHGERTLDIQTWLKQSRTDDLRRINFLRSCLGETTLLDFGCGAGGFIEEAQSMANQIYGIEPEKRLQDSFKQRRLSVYTNLSEFESLNIKCDIITAFHVIEHLQDPVMILKRMAKILQSDGTIIIEVPSSNDALLTLYNSTAFSHFTYWSQHLYLFNPHTLAMLANAADFKINWIKQVQRYPLSNHLFWLAKEQPGGHKIWGFLESHDLNAAYENQLAAAGLCDTLIMSLSQS